MRSSILLGSLLLSSSLFYACGSTSTGRPATKTDAGATDASSTTDSGGGDDSTPGDDTGTTTTPPSDATGTTTSPTDSGGGGDAALSSCNPHTGDECNIVLQNCGGGTKVCAYDDTSKHNKCVDVSALGGAGSGTAGSPCSVQKDCDVGLFCQESHCTPACCTGDNSPCGAGGTCNLDLTNTAGTTVYTVCTYSAICHPFAYDCSAAEYCVFSAAPDTFKCTGPSPTSGGLGTKPGNPCNYVNDCGESQVCITKAGADGGAGTCALVCQVTGSPTVGSTPGGRFPANGTCTVGGKSYGTCTGGLFGASSPYGICQ